ncbi:MAG: ferredoxin-type protein NapF [Hahellaceae bacterium]|nr:ferredoxin-type protein NapF [Hahellaceae bacterium]MCP5168306.1 ferredoxin-type protein NapF [Hahellaceae bacterium]
MSGQVNLGRRALLRGRFEPPVDALLPPWALDAGQFYEQCTRCDECISACPEQILIKGQGGFPVVDFKQGECTFCGDCEKICTSNALDARTRTIPWQQTAQVDERCLALQQTVCRSCGEACEPRAIHYEWLTRGIARPVVNNDLCNGCGACVGICPTQAIQIQKRTASFQEANQ